LRSRVARPEDFSAGRPGSRRCSLCVLRVTNRPSIADNLAATNQIFDLQADGLPRNTDQFGEVIAAQA
jgi:hypothetical protein